MSSNTSSSAPAPPAYISDLINYEHHIVPSTSYRAPGKSAIQGLSSSREQLDSHWSQKPLQSGRHAVDQMMLAAAYGVHQGLCLEIDLGERVALRRLNTAKKRYEHMGEGVVIDIHLGGRPDLGGVPFLSYIVRMGKYSTSPQEQFVYELGEIMRYGQPFRCSAEDAMSTYVDFDIHAYTECRCMLLDGTTRDIVLPVLYNAFNSSCRPRGRVPSVITHLEPFLNRMLAHSEENARELLLDDVLVLGLDGHLRHYDPLQESGYD